MSCTFPSAAASSPGERPTVYFPPFEVLTKDLFRSSYALDTPPISTILATSIYVSEPPPSEATFKNSILDSPLSDFSYRFFCNAQGPKGLAYTLAAKAIGSTPRNGQAASALRALLTYSPSRKTCVNGCRQESRRDSPADWRYRDRNRDYRSLSLLALSGTESTDSDLNRLQYVERKLSDQPTPWILLELSWQRIVHYLGTEATLCCWKVVPDNLPIPMQ